MKIAAAILVLIIIGVASFIFFSVENSAPEKISPSFTVTALNETVSIKKSGEIDFVPIVKEAETLAGSHIKTSPTGRALIETGSIIITTVDRNSEFTVNQYDHAGSSFTLHSGNMWSRIEKSLEQGEFYEVGTDTGVATVRGTSFGTSYSNEKMKIMVTKGVVSAFRIDGGTKKRITGSETKIPAGSKGIITRDKIEVSVFTKEDTSDSWFLLNTDLTDAPKDTTPSGTTASPKPSTGTQTQTPAGTVAAPKPTLTITGISPTSLVLTSGESLLMTLTGSGFLKVQTLIVDKQSISDFQVIDDTRLRFSSRALNQTTGTKMHDLTLVAIDRTTVSAQITLNVETNVAPQGTQNPTTASPNTPKP